jgi:hypothetical protein
VFCVPQFLQVCIICRDAIYRVSTNSGLTSRFLFPQPPLKRGAIVSPKINSRLYEHGGHTVIYSKEEFVARLISSSSESASKGELFTLVSEGELP